MAAAAVVSATTLAAAGGAAAGATAARPRVATAVAAAPLQGTTATAAEGAGPHFCAELFSQALFFRPLGNPHELTSLSPPRPLWVIFRIRRDDRGRDDRPRYDDRPPRFDDRRMDDRRGGGYDDRPPPRDDRGYDDRRGCAALLPNLFRVLSLSPPPSLPSAAEARVLGTWGSEDVTLIALSV